MFNQLVEQNFIGMAKAKLVGSILPLSHFSATDLERCWLSLESESNQYFSLSWTWIGSWLETVKDKTQVFVFDCRDGEKLVAMCFLTVCHIKRFNNLIPIRQLQINEFLANGLDMVISYNGLVGAREHLGEAWKCFLEVAKKWDRGWDEIALSSLTSDQYVLVKENHGSLKFSVDKVFYTWRVPLNKEFESIEELINSMKRKSRQQLRQSYKSYSEIGRLEIKEATGVEEALQYFTELGALHTKRWNKVGEKGSFANSHWVQFHESMIRKFYGAGNVRLFQILCKGHCIGYLYGHEHKNAMFMHQTGFEDSGENKLRPGYISHCLAMSYLSAREVESYDLLPDSDDSYKKFLAEKGEEVYWLLLQKRKLRFYIEKILRGSWLILRRFYR